MQSHVDGIKYLFSVCRNNYCTFSNLSYECDSSKENYLIHGFEKFPIVHLMELIIHTSSECSENSTGRSFMHAPSLSLLLKESIFYKLAVRECTIACDLSTQSVVGLPKLDLLSFRSFIV